MCLVLQNGDEVCLQKVTRFLPEDHSLLVPHHLDILMYGWSVVGSQSLQLVLESVAQYGVGREGKRMGDKEAEIRNCWSCEETFLRP